MKNKIEDLRNHLFMQLERLNDEEIMDDPQKYEKELKRANAIKEVGTVLVESAKAEVQLLRSIGGKGTGFIPNPMALGSGNVEEADE